MASDLGDYVQKALKARGMSMRTFAARVRQESSYVSKVVAGERAIGRGKIPTWAQTLGLEGQDLADFEELAYLALSPPEVRKLVKKLRQQLAERG